MKYINLFILLVVALSYACRDESTLNLNIDDVPKGIYVTFEMESASINSEDLGNTFIGGTFGAPSNNVAKHDIYVKRIYDGGANETEYLYLESVTSFPINWTVDANQLASLFNVDVNELFGNFFDFDCQAIGSSGDTATFNNLDNDLKITPEQLQGFQFTGAIVCPSDPELITGTYSSLSSGSSTDGGATNNPSVDFAHTITITETDVNGEYTISDFSGGLYLNWYEVYGVTGDLPGTIQDVCGVYAFANTFDPWGAPVMADVIFNGDGTITIDAVNGWGDAWVTTLTKQ